MTTAMQPVEEDLTPEVQGPFDVNVTTEDVLGCLQGGQSSLILEATDLWLHLLYTGNRSGWPRLHMPSTCWLQVIGHGEGSMSLLILHDTCLPDNRLVVHSRTWNGLGYDCDPTAWVAPGVELIMTSNVANVSIEINDVGMSCSLQVQFKLVQDRRRQLLARRYVTRYLGVLVFVDTLTFKACCQ